MKTEQQLLNEYWFASRHLEEMKQLGSMVSLSWGEDTDEWECEWITGGERYIGRAETMVGAVFNARGAGELANVRGKTKETN